jgi:hypothetical protein
VIEAFEILTGAKSTVPKTKHNTARKRIIPTFHSLYPANAVIGVSSIQEFA